MSRRAYVVALMILLLGSGNANAVSVEWVARWSEDIRFVEEQIREVHPDAFTKLQEVDFERGIQDLISRLTELEHHEIVVELAEVVAGLGDGHTRLSLPLAPGVEFFQGHSPTPPSTIEELRFRAFPIRLGLYGDDAFVLRATEEHAELLGGRVTRYGTGDVSAAIERVSATVRHDNEAQLRELTPDHLVLAEVLHARGVTPELGVLDLEVETPAGARLERRLEAELGPGALLDLPTERIPRLVSRASEPYWFEWMPETNVVYFQFNQVGGAEGEPLDELSARLTSELARRNDASLVIDLRNNPGGWYGTAKFLRRSLLGSNVASDPGRLLVLTDSTTFSAAMMFSVDLEKDTHALFLGSETGSSPNHHGDAARKILPNSGLTLRVSTLYWQAHPSDQRSSIDPHLAIAPTFEDRSLGRDPVLEAAFEIAGRKTDAVRSGRWRGKLSFPQSEKIDVGLSVREEDGALRADWSFPSFGVKKLTLGEVESRHGRLRGTAPWQGGNVRRVTIEATQRGNNLVGLALLEAEMGTERLPFLLERLEEAREKGSQGN